MYYSLCLFTYQNANLIRRKLEHLIQGVSKQIVQTFSCHYASTQKNHTNATIRKYFCVVTYLINQ